MKKTQLSKQKNTKSLLTTINTGYSEKHDDIPVKQPIFIDSHIHNESIMDSIETGFDKQNIITLECKKPKQFIALYKENYLNEFKSESEKEKVRENLEVYGKSEVSKIISDVINDSTLSFITKSEIEEIIYDLEVVSAKSKSHVNYEIPDKLFKS